MFPEQLKIHDTILFFKELQTGSLSIEQKQTIARIFKKLKYDILERKMEFLKAKNKENNKKKEIDKIDFPRKSIFGDEVWVDKKEII